MASWLSSAMSKLRKCCASSKRISAPCRLANWRYQTHRGLSLRPLSVVEERNKQQAVVMIGYPGADVLSPDRTFLDLLNEASNDLGSRFFNRIREQMGLAYFVGAGNFAGLAPGSFVFFLGTDPKKVEAVTAELQQEIEACQRTGLPKKNLLAQRKAPRF